MPRRARLVIPGGLYHIIARGLERREIFRDKIDYAEFLDRLEIGLEKSSCRCFAWVLMPNHFHLLIQAGPQGTAPLMRRLMTGYAGHFNRRHDRVGHLFQNRYKSILCDRDRYFLELVRYIHLNPLRAELVRDVAQLKFYPWAGHGGLLGYKPRSFQSIDDVLVYFGGQRPEAIERYLKYIHEGASQGAKPELMGGGLRRSHNNNHRTAAQVAFDDRVLGNETFVQEALKTAEKEGREKIRLSLQELAHRVAIHTGVQPEDIFSKGRREPVSRSKALLIYLATQFKGESGKTMGDLTGMTTQAASKARSRGEILWKNSPELNKLIS